MCCPDLFSDCYQDEGLHEQCCLQAVTKLVAASGGSHFAASLVGGHVAMAMQAAKGTSGMEWLLAGCSRQLPAAVAGIAFGEAPTGQTRFFSLGGPANPSQAGSSIHEACTVIDLVIHLKWWCIVLLFLAQGVQRTTGSSVLLALCQH